MSHTSKITDPKNNPGPVDTGLAPDKDTLISEFKKLDAQLAAVNDGIVKAREQVTEGQQTIIALREQGLQFVGQANVIGRILHTMGVDAQALATAPAQVAEGMESAPATSEEAPAGKRGLKNRFSPR